MSEHRKPAGSLLSLSGVTKRFGKVVAVRDFSLQVAAGELLVVVGPSGCGKTTLLRLIAGLETPEAGRVVLAGHDITHLPPERRGVGMVFQDYALFPHLNVYRNVTFGLRGGGREKRARAEEVLELVGLKGLGGRYPHELSAGEQQRVALARALAPQPYVLLLDEPFSNLDPDLRLQVREEVRQILKETGTTAIFVTHDQEEAFFMADRIAVMNAGRLEQVDTPEAVFRRPASPFVVQLVGIADFLAGEIRGEAVYTEVGRFPAHNGLPEGTKVKVVVRPDDVELQPSEDGGCVIVDRVFQGAHYLYRVKLPSGAVVRCLQHRNRAYPPNTRVALKIEPGHDLVYFVDGAETSREGGTRPKPF